MISIFIYNVYHAIPESNVFDKYGVKSKSFYSSGREYRNEVLAMQFYELNQGKTMYKASPQEAKKALDERILGFIYHDKDYRGFFVDQEGRVYIGVSKSWIAGQSMINSIWWKYIDGNDTGMLYYRTEPDIKVAELSKKMKQEMNEELAKSKM